MRLTRATPRKLETAQQILFIDWATKCVLYDGEPLVEWIWHTPNGGKRHPRVAAELKRMGTKKGVPDITCAIAAGVFHGFYGELKVGNEKPTTEQAKLHARLMAGNYRTVVAYSAAELAAYLTQYLRAAPLQLLVKARLTH